MVDIWHIYHPQSPIIIRFVGLLLKNAHVLRIIWRFRCPLQHHAQTIAIAGRSYRLKDQSQAKEEKTPNKTTGEPSHG